MSRYEFSKEWCTNMAALEGDAEIGAGALSGDPDIPPREIRAWRDWSGGSLRHHWSDRLDGPDTPGAHYIRADTLPQWQPIEKLPDDGVHVHVWDGVSIRLAYHHWGIWYSAETNELLVGHEDEDVTAWQPLPEPPAD